MGAVGVDKFSPMGNWLPLTIVFLVAFLGILVLLLYNGLVKARNMTDESWSGIDVQLKRRRDLIPNLVTTVQAYAAHERQTFDSVTEARVIAEAAAVGGGSPAVKAENSLTRSLGGLFMVAEQYPDLKASQNFIQLQQELANIETNIVGARSIFNGNARNYNDKIQSFPALLIAGTLGFKDRAYFEATSIERTPAVVGF